MKIRSALFLLLIISSILIKAQDNYVQYGGASFYADKFEGKTTANGEKYSQTKLTAAHLSLPFGTMVRVTNTINKKSVVVRINDRGHFVDGRIIDLSKAAATKLNFIKQGTTEVKVELLDKNLEPIFKDTIKEENEKMSESNNAEYYSVESASLSPTGYGVQIGSFREIANILEVSDKVKEEYKDIVVVQLVQVNNVKVYRIILGVYNSKSEAEELKSKIKEEYPDCFVIEYAE